ncbi:MAG: hypothetical protein CM1200mP14_05730 [Gammaproteobacteria bacterium]|nr:MAG: hypothetical protein CM1200mP14_05730 [Gammaproteobacteria bacterium]
MLNRMFDFTWKSTWRNTTGIAVVLALVGFGAAEIAAQNTGTVTGLVLTILSRFRLPVHR